jgi:hypothetical protein
MGEEMTAFVILTATCASIACFLIVACDVIYEDAPRDSPKYIHDINGVMISVGCLALPLMVIKLLADLF